VEDFIAEDAGSAETKTERKQTRRVVGPAESIQSPIFLCEFDPSVFPSVITAVRGFP
jgi:hypothetical protein